MKWIIIRQIELEKLSLNLSQRLDLKSLNDDALQNLFITHFKNARQQYKNNKLKTVAPT